MTPPRCWRTLGPRAVAAGLCTAALTASLLAVGAPSTAAAVEAVGAAAAASTPATWSGTVSYNRTTSQSTPAFCSSGSGTLTLEQSESWTFTLPARATVMGSGVTVSLQGTLSGTGRWVSVRTCNGVEQARSTVNVAGSAPYEINIEQLDATGDKIAITTDRNRLSDGIAGTQVLAPGGSQAVAYWPAIAATTVAASKKAGSTTTFAATSPTQVSLDDGDESFIVDSFGFAFNWGTAPLHVSLVRGADLCTTKPGVQTAPCPELRMATVKWPKSSRPRATFEVRISKASPKNFTAWRSTGKKRSAVFKKLELTAYVVQIRSVSGGVKSKPLKVGFTVTEKFRLSS